MMQLENLNCGINVNGDIRQLFPHSKEELPLMNNLMTDIIQLQDLHTLTPIDTLLPEDSTTTLDLSSPRPKSLSLLEPSLPFFLVCYAHQKERFILDRLCLSRRKGRLYLI